MEKTVKLSRESVGMLCRELGLLLRSGVTADEGLALLHEERPEDSVVARLAELADSGLSLAASVRESGAFPAYAAGLIEIGGQSGRLEESLFALSDYYDSRARAARQLRDSLLYPAILLVIMLAVIVVLLAKVLPIFDSVYAQLGGQLTGVAGSLLAVGGVLSGMMPVLCALLLAAAVFFGAFALFEPFRDAVLAAWTKHRGDRGTGRLRNAARAAQALAMGMRSGLPLEESLELAAGLVADIPAAAGRCRRCRELLEEGASLSEAVAQTDLLPGSECRLLSLAMRSGTGDAVMEQIAQRLSERSEEAMKAQAARIEPALVVLTSLLVGLILLAVMLPLMHIMAAIG